MDGENHGKPLLKCMIWGSKNPLCLEGHPMIGVKITRKGGSPSNMAPYTSDLELNIKINSGRKD